MHGILETFWAIVLALFGALAIGGLIVGAVILAMGCVAFGFAWLVFRRRRRSDAERD